MEDGAVKIVTPTEDTPAFRAGLKAGDYITHLDGVLIYGGTLDEAVDKMRGTPGSPIKLTVVRPGRDKPFDVTVKREIIQLRPVKWEAKRSEEHTSELQSLMRISYAVFCLKKKKQAKHRQKPQTIHK